MRTAILLLACVAVAAWAIPALADGPDTPEKAAKPSDKKDGKEHKKFKPPDDGKDDDKKDGKKDERKFKAPEQAFPSPKKERKFPETQYLGSASLWFPLAYPDYNGSSTVSKYGVNLDVLTFTYRWQVDSGVRLTIANAGGLFYAKEQCAGACLQNVIFNGFGLGYERFFGKSETFVPSAYLSLGPALVVENFTEAVLPDQTNWHYRWGFTGELGALMRYRPKDSEWCPFFQAKATYFYYNGLADSNLFGFGVGIGIEHRF
jgi:hypothetical protein